MNPNEEKKEGKKLGNGIWMTKEAMSVLLDGTRSLAIQEAIAVVEKAKMDFDEIFLEGTSIYAAVDKGFDYTKSKLSALKPSPSKQGGEV